MRKRSCAVLIAIACSFGSISVLSADNTSFYNLGSASSEAKFADVMSAKIEKKLSKSNDKQLKRLYKELLYLPVWVGVKAPTKFSNQLMEYFKNDREVEDIATLQTLYKRAKDALKKAYGKDATDDDRVDAELMMSRFYLSYMDFKVYGGIDWQKFDEVLKELSKKYNAQVGWDRYKPPFSPSELLIDAVINEDFPSVFKRTEPKRFKYSQLKSYLFKYMDIRDRGGWERLPKYRRIKPYKKSRVIPIIRKHLLLTQDLRDCNDSIDTESLVYDKCLQKAIRRYKIRHGLRGTTKIDRETWRLLSEPVDTLITEIRLNLDRIKWLYRKEERVRIELNIPAFRLYFYDGKELVNTMRVITGKPNHPTPSFHDKMEYLIVNPYWKIPESIVKQEMLRHLIKDPYYYERRGKYLYSSWDENSPRVNPGSINWAKYRKKGKHIPYYFMQVPGTSNALGKIKFLFPNKYSVYIHDTPTKKLFFENKRAFSHGCMRIQKPREMLKTLALYNDNIDVEELMELLKTRRKKTVVLHHKIPVDITYLTAFVDDYGNLHFRDDIYGYDKYQLQDYRYKFNYVPKKIIKMDNDISNEINITKESNVSDINISSMKEIRNTISNIEENNSKSMVLDNNQSFIDNNKSIDMNMTENNITISQNVSKEANTTQTEDKNISMDRDSNITSIHQEKIVAQKLMKAIEM